MLLAFLFLSQKSVRDTHMYILLPLKHLLCFQLPVNILIEGRSNDYQKVSKTIAITKKRCMSKHYQRYFASLIPEEILL